jgi:hypothetical protein
MDEQKLDVTAAKVCWECTKQPNVPDVCPIGGDPAIACRRWLPNAARVGLALAKFKEDYDQAVSDALRVVSPEVPHA